MSRAVVLILASVIALGLACEREPVALRGAPAPHLPDYTKLLPAFRADFEKHDLTKADAASDYKAAHPEWFAITIPPKGTFRAMREWEAMQAILLSISDGIDGYGAVAITLVDIVRASWPVGKVWLIYEAESARTAFTTLLTNAGVPAANIGVGKPIEFVKSEVDAIWMIDFGPFPLIDDAAGTFAFLDWKYYPSRYHDDAVPTRLGQLWGVTTYRQDFSFEGGNFQADGAGTCYTTERALENTGVSTAALQKQLDDYASCANLVVLKDLHDDGTGHLDMFFKLAAIDTVLLGSFTAAQDAVSRADMNTNEAILEAVPLPGGASMTVWRLPHPNHDGATPRTYLNSTLFNGRNLWPNYSNDKDIEADAVSAWESALPDWQHVPILSDEIALWSGAVHCVTRTLPAASSAKWVADGACSASKCVAPGGGYSGPCGSSAACFGPQWMAYCVESGFCADTCQGVSYEGCCDGQTVTWCENGVLKSSDCATNAAGLSCGWDSASSWYYCGTAGGSDPSGAHPKACPVVCVPGCAGKSCGDDGCDGSCGACAEGLSCVDGGCACVPDCVGASCGGDGCGGVCGSCPAGQACNAQGQCACQPDCSGKACGSDGCSGTCGTCDAGAACQGGQCVCQPDCVGRVCGSNGCGGSCGACGDGQSCTDAGACVAGPCTPSCAGRECGPDGCGGICGDCTDTNGCTADTCVDGDCVFDATAKDDQPCPDDGLTCTLDRCSDGACDHVRTIGCLIDGACHANGDANPVNACQRCDQVNPLAWTPRLDDSPCDDGDACTTGDACRVGACVGGDLTACPALSSCHKAGACDPVTGACSTPVLPDGTACDDGNAATGNDRCEDGVCAGLPCACQGSGACCAGCLAVNEGGACDDGDPCTKADTCNAGACQPGTPTICPSAGPCRVSGSCQPATGLCSDPPAKDGLPCDDGDLCTEDDGCADGLCLGGAPLPCPPAPPCHGEPACVPATGACSAAPLQDGTACVLAANGAGTCLDGVCVPEGCTCSAISACCDGCLPRGDGGACDDQSLCTTNDTCAAGHCLGVSSVTCPAPGPCQSAITCDPSTALCVTTAVAQGSPCDDGDPLTQGDACSAEGLCEGQPVGPDAVETAPDNGGCHDGCDEDPAAPTGDPDLDRDGGGSGCSAASRATGPGALVGLLAMLLTVVLRRRWRAHVATSRGDPPRTR